MRCTATTNYLAQNVSSAKVEIPRFRVLGSNHQALFRRAALPKGRQLLNNRSLLSDVPVLTVPGAMLDP